MQGEENEPTPSRGAVILKKILHYLVHNILIFAILFGLILGVVTGIIMKLMRTEYSKRDVMYVNFIGSLYIRGLQLMTLPLIIASIITSLTNLSLRFAGMLGLRAFLYYMITTLLAAVWGLILVSTIRPGKDSQKTVHHDDHHSFVRESTMIDAVLDLIRNIFPPNLIEACIRTYRTELVTPTNLTLKPDGTFEIIPDTAKDKYEWDFNINKFSTSTNYLGVCVASIVFGICTIVVATSTQVIKEVFEALNEIVITIVTIIIWTSPIGVFSLVAAKVIEERDYEKLLMQFAWYSLTILIGIFTFGCVFLQLVYFVCTRKNPITFTFNMTEAITTAFATASSLVTLPVTLRCVIEKNHIPATVARFVVPLGATVNMNGTALYEAVAPIFIAQVLEVDLTVMQIILTCIIATLASVGAAGIPQAGLITMVMVLNILNLEAKHLVYIIAVDWLLDRFRTALNIFGDAVGAAVVFALSSKDFKEAQMAVKDQQ